MKILETAMGTLAGFVGALGGMTIIGICLAAAVILIPFLCCGLPILVAIASGQ